MPKAGQNAVFKLDDSGGTLTDRSDKLNQIDRAVEVALHDVTTFGETARRFIPGLRNRTITINVFTDKDMESHLDSVLGMRVSVEIGPYGDDSGESQITGEVYVQNWSGGTPVDGVDTSNVQLQFDGDATLGSY